MRQNACIMTTAIDETTGKTMLNYIPMALSSDILDVLLEYGSNCDNKEAIYFELTTDKDTFWKEFWNELKGDKD